MPLTAIEAEFGGNADYAMLIREYGREASEDRSPPARRYSPNKVTTQDVKVISGNPDPERIPTSYVERHNLSMRMGMRRFTRLTNAFLKKVENHAAAVSLNMMWMNFGRLPTRTPAPRPWRRVSAITSGPLRRSRRCSTRLIPVQLRILGHATGIVFANLSSPIGMGLFTLH
jgi:hypothetical protein